MPVERSGLETKEAGNVWALVPWRIMAHGDPATLRSLGPWALRNLKARKQGNNKSRKRGVMAPKNQGACSRLIPVCLGTFRDLETGYRGTLRHWELDIWKSTGRGNKTSRNQETRRARVQGIKEERDPEALVSRNPGTNNPGGQGTLEPGNRLNEKP